MAKIKVNIDLDIISTIIPEVVSIPVLPRKKKKALKKKISQNIVSVVEKKILNDSRDEIYTQGFQL